MTDRRVTHVEAPTLAEIDVADFKLYEMKVAFIKSRHWEPVPEMTPNAKGLYQKRIGLNEFLQCSLEDALAKERYIADAVAAMNPPPVDSHWDNFPSFKAKTS